MSEPIGNRRIFQPLAGGGYGFSLIDDGVLVEIRRVRIERHQVFGEVNVICEWAGASTFQDTKSISCADLNLSSLPAISARAKHCAARAKSRPQDFDWLGALDDACRLVIEAERHSTAGIVLDDAPEDGPPRDFLVHGLAIPADSHSHLVCDGGGLKSLIILLVLGEMAKAGIPVGLVDWEWNAARHLARKQRLFGADRLEHLHYLRCRNSLSVERDHVRRFCDERRLQFIGIDSIGAACDGKLADDDVARAFNRALDDLPPSLAAAHVPKAPTEATADLKAFGSAFFHNFCRASWTVKKQVGASEDVVTVMLVPHKQNDGTRLKPVGLEFYFAPQRIQVRNVDPVTVDGLSQTLPLHMRIRSLLRSGPRTIAELASELDAKLNTVSKAVDRSRGFIKLANNPDGIQRIGLLEERRTA
jgi:hypothetical protein